MENVIQAFQIAVATSVFFVWTFRIHNVIKEFEQFGFNEIQRSLIGASKLCLSTLLIVGIWYSNMVFIPSCLMACFMIGAQYYHFKIKDPVVKYIPSFILLMFSIFILINSIPI